jgi:flagellar motor switch/type III secretory pathway protein FliN
MKPQPELVAARPAAQHCEELTRGARGVEIAEALRAASYVSLARQLTDSLRALFAGTRIDVAIEEGPSSIGTDILKGSKEPNRHTLLNFPAASGLLSVDHATMTALTDLSFGGSGAAPETPPARLPASSLSLYRLIAGTIAGALATVDGFGGPVTVGASDECAATLKPFAPKERCAQLRIDILANEPPGWSLRLFLPQQVFDALSGAVPHRPSKDADLPAKAGRQPFAEIPLSLRVVLGEIDLPLAALQRLVPGQELPFAISKEIPLEVNGRIAGRGTVGAFDGRIAIELTQLNEENKA